MKLLNHPVISYIIISVISLACAIALFQLGGSLAEITGNEKNAIGFGFKAGGAIAGFILIFILSQKAINNFQEINRRNNPTINVKIYLQSKPNNFERNGSAYTVEYIIFNEDSGEKKTVSAGYTWEAGYLTVLAKDLGDRDYLTIRVTNDKNNSWESDSFHSRSPKIAELKQLN